MPDRDERDTLEMPAGAARFAEADAVRFEYTTDNEEAGGNLRVFANSGQPIEGHWYWGNFAIDLDGLEVGRQAKPILLDHDASAIVGYTHTIEKTEDGIVAEGTILSGEGDDFAAARKVSNLAAQGFPWQASVYVPPLSVERVPAGKSATVNGFTLDGPGHIFRKSVLREVTVTSLGADENTDAEMFREGKERIVAKLTDASSDVETCEIARNISEVEQAELSLGEDTGGAAVEPASVDPTADTAMLSDQITDAVATERQRIARLMKASEPHQSALLSDLIEKGVELTEGLEALIDDAKTFKAGKLEQLAEEAPESVEFSDESSDHDGSDEGKARAKFAASPELQEEFLNNVDLYLSWCQVEGSIEGSA
jgi:hypothetical protein